MHLPRYLAVMQADTIANAAIVDQEVVEEVSRLGFDCGFLTSSIKDKIQNKVRLGSRKGTNYVGLYRASEGRQAVKISPSCRRLPTGTVSLPPSPLRSELLSGKMRRDSTYQWPCPY